jgi:hypothetical protein
MLMNDPNKEQLPPVPSASGKGHSSNKGFKAPKPNKWQSRANRPNVTQWQDTSQEWKPGK